MGLSGPFAEAAASLNLSDEPETPAPLETADTPSAPPVDSAPVEPPASATEPPATPREPAPAPVAPVADEWKTDAQGRLHRPDGTIASRAEADNYKATRPEAPVEGTVAPEPAPPSPYVFAGHETPILEGALVHPESGDVFIPASQRDNLERWVMRGQKYEQFRDDRRDAIQRADVAEKRGSARVAALVDALPFLHSREAFLEFLGNAAANEDAAINTFDRIDLAIQRQLDAVDRQFGPAAARPVETQRDQGNATPGAPLDRDDATEAFTDHFRTQLARPEFRGMPADLQSQVRNALADVQLFVRDQDGDWCLNENAAAPIWAMAKQAMSSATTAVRAKDFNATQVARASATSAAPPSVAAGKPRVGATTVSRSPAPRDPMIDPRTGKQWDNPWDAINKAF